MAKPKKHVFVCMQDRPPGHPRGSCGSRGCSRVYDEFMFQWQQRELWGPYKLTHSGCIGPCKEGPNVLIYPDGIMYSNVTPEDVTTIIEEHILGDRPVDRLRASPEFW